MLVVCFFNPFHCFIMCFIVFSGMFYRFPEIRLLVEAIEANTVLTSLTAEPGDDYYKRDKRKRVDTVAPL